MAGFTRDHMPKLIVLLLPLLASCAIAPQASDPASDAPEAPRSHAGVVPDIDSYRGALELWRTPEDVNAWIGARFTYDTPRAIALSESQRNKSGPLPIHPPGEFFASPSGVCVDLSRFAVETLGQIDPDLAPRYLMIEFAPVTIDGNTLRLHWLAMFKRGGNYYFFADSKRPGYMAGPYSSTREFIEAYSTYRGRQVVAFRELESYRRKQRTLASKQESQSSD